MHEDVRDGEPSHLVVQEPWYAPECRQGCRDSALDIITIRVTKDANRIDTAQFGRKEYISPKVPIPALTPEGVT